jgi:hypothetical protein
MPRPVNDLSGGKKSPRDLPRRPHQDERPPFPERGVPDGNRGLWDEAPVGLVQAEVADMARRVRAERRRSRRSARRGAVNGPC